MHKKANKKSALILLWKKINKNRYQNIIKASAFYKIQIFFLVLFKQTFFWYMSKMYLWVLTLVTLFEPTLVGQLSHSFLITYILEVASNSIALCYYHYTVDLLFDWFGISCMTIDNFCFYLQSRLIQAGQTRGQLYSDTSSFSVPCYSICCNITYPVKIFFSFGNSVNFC